MSALTSPVALNSPVQDRLSLLAEPFDAKYVKWQIIATSYRDPDHPTAKAVVVAHPLAYLDRLQDVCGPAGWSRSFAVTVVPGLMREMQTGGTTVEVANQTKIILVCTLSIDGIGTHSATGESWAETDDSIRLAEEQAFRGACQCFGLGRYLLDVPTTDWLPTNRLTKQLAATPPLPKWAQPGPRKCAGCAGPITAARVFEQSYTAAEMAQRGLEVHGQPLCHLCQLATVRTKRAALQSSDK